MGLVRLCRVLTFAVAVAGVVVPLDASSQRPAAQPAALKIVVVAGEGGVNIIQQKTAVAPVIEVRDRNDQPVAGAVVKFAIRGGRATFNGARTVSAVTDGAGRAVASGLTPTGSGALQINASAAFQGQTAAVTIAQTNVMTAAEAAAAVAAASAAIAAAGTGTAAVGGAAAAGTAAAGGAAAGGAGISLTTIAIVGGAVAAGGAVVATKAVGGSGNDAPGHAYSGQFSGDIPLTGPPPFCGFIARVNTGTLVIHVEQLDAGTAKGTAEVNEDATTVYAPSCNLANRTEKLIADITSLSGNESNLSFNLQVDNTFGSGATAGVRTWTLSFTGSLKGGEIVGMLTNTEANRSTSGPSITASGTTAFPITLR